MAIHQHAGSHVFTCAISLTIDKCDWSKPRRLTYDGTGHLIEDSEAREN